MRNEKKSDRVMKRFLMILLVIVLVAGCEFIYALENLDEMEIRKDRMATANWGNQYLEDPSNNYIWQPETLSYTDITTGHEVWVIVRQPDYTDIYSKEHGSNVWSHDGSRIGFFDYVNRGTANPEISNDRDAMRWIVNTDGGGLKAAEGYGNYHMLFSDFGWAHTELAYYSFGSHSIIDIPTDTLCKMTLNTNNVVVGVSILDTSSVNDYQKDLVKDGVSSNDKWITCRDFIPSEWSDPNNQLNSTGIYFIGLDGSPAVDSYWGLGRAICDEVPCTSWYWGDSHDTDTSEQRFHDVWALGFNADWIVGDYSGTSDIFALFKKSGSYADGGPEFESWDGDSWGVNEEIKVISDGGYVLDNPYGVPYFGHPVFDKWSRYGLVGTYTDSPVPGTRIWDSETNSFLPNYVLAYNKYDGQHHSWTGWTDYVIAVNPDWPPGLADAYYLHMNKWDESYENTVLIADSHYEGPNTNYNAYPRPSQSPDGTKVAFAQYFLNNGQSYPYISYAVAYYPYPPEITQTTALGGIATIRFDWGLDTANPRGYTDRGWPDEIIDNPPAPRETKEFRLWRSPDSVTWTPIGTVNANPFDKFDFANGGLKTGQNSYWEITDNPGDGTWYYSVTSVEHSGLESRKLSNVYSITISGGAGAGSQSIAYPSNPGEVNNFYNSAPSSPSGFNYQATGILGHYQLNWTEPADSMIRYYNVYYSNQSNPSAIQQQRIASLPVGTSEYLDWLADQNNPGYYGITSVDRQGNEGEIVYLALGDTCQSLGYNCCDVCEAGTEQSAYDGDCVGQVCCGTCIASTTCGLADTDFNGNVNMTEIINYMAEQKAGNVTVVDLMSGIDEWKNGCV